MSDASALKRFIDWLPGSKKRRLNAQVMKFRREQATRREKMRREAGIPAGVELLPNGSIADPDIHLRWLIERIASSGGSQLRLDRAGITCLPDEIRQIAPNVRKLTVRDQTQSVFDRVGVLDQLEEIEIGRCAVINLSPLANCSRLKSLKITCAVEDELTSLPSLPELEQLTVQISSVAGLTANLPQLRSIDLKTCYNVPRDVLQGKPLLAVAKLPNTGDKPVPAENPTNMRKLVRKSDALDLSDIGAMTGLTSLELEATEAADLSPLSALKNLTYLHLRAPKAASFSPFEGLTALENLIMPSWRGENALPDLSWLRGCPMLTDLRINIKPGADLAELVHLPPLEYLHLGFSGPIDFSPLSALTSVKSLMLRADPPEASVRNLTLPGGLSTLCLKGHAFTSLDILTSASFLTKLSLDDCGISDLSPLKSQVGLMSLGLYRSEVTDLSVLRHLPAFNAKDTKAQLHIREGAVLDAYPSLRPCVEHANEREAGMDAMSNLVRAAVALVS